jgi:hydroxymethylpyrimidine/phosphomethylpyrimidine kinase
MREKSRRPSAESVCVLTIGGLDPGGGAGILADARAVAHAGAFACAAISLVTIQSTSGLRSATAVPARQLTAQCAEVLEVQRVRAIKIGALGSVENALAMAKLLAVHRDLPSVVDTVMLPTRGRARLLDERALGSLRERLLPRATVVTANAPEAEVLSERRVTRLTEAHEAALALLALGPRAVLVKGGHLSGREAVDVLVVREREKSEDVRVIELATPRLRLPPVHGGGCALASLVAAKLAFAHDTTDAIALAVRAAKNAHHAALARAGDVGGEMRVLFASN